MNGSGCRNKKGERKTESKTYIYVRDEDKIWSKVCLQEIYFIETIKATHYCDVITKKGAGKLHADITRLQEELPPNFFKVRASTLINLDLVQKIDIHKRMLYFSDKICCTYTQRVSKQLKKLLRIQSYRSYGGVIDDADTDISI